MRELLHLFQTSAEFQEISAGIQSGVRQQLIYGLAGSQRSYFLAAVREKLQRPILVVTSDRNQGEKLASDLAAFLGEEGIFLFPASEVVSFDVIAQSTDTAQQRLQVLERLARGENLIVIAPVRALLTRLVPPDVFRRAPLALRVGQRLPMDDLAMALTIQGYERLELVESRGQYSIRGGIVDIYPLVGERPLRLEFFGDEVDSIRSFDPVSQRSLANLKAAAISPASELVLPLPARERGIKALLGELEQRLKRLREINKKNELTARIRGLVEKLEQGIPAVNLSQYLPYFYPEAVTLLDYLPPETLIFLDEPGRVKEAAGAAETIFQEAFLGALEGARVLPGQVEINCPYHELLQLMQQRPLFYLTLLLRQIPQTQPERIINFVSRPLYAFQGKFAVLCQEIGSLVNKLERVVICTGTEERGAKLLTLLTEQGLPVRFEPALQTLPPPGQILVTVGSLESGFEFPGLHLAVITDAEVIARPRRRPHSRATRKGERQLHLPDLRTGDYVVHVNHGIGRYLGVKTLTIDGVQKDYIFIQYTGEDRLYVPVDQIGLVQRYIGAEGHEPRISKLGGSEWAKVKTSVKAAVEQMAAELLELYAARQTLPGLSFSPDTVWQQEFEDRFPYEETADQLQTVSEIKADMESERPMDRLLCGDVGYGKTEVALRAAFKAIMDGKQVAVLVPTTILAQQHYNTFRDRLKEYPVTVAMLSRFCPPREQKETVKGLAEGVVDVIIGTHRLLQEDIQFKELGLVIVDEEQRFGVAHKERLKQLRLNVDVLTLTATPIPRTLQMSLVGLRDMSTINEPPEDRYPVQTYVMEYDSALVQDAITRELDRGGQVYYVHNVVQTIDRAARQLQKLLPEARLAIGHGQMKEDDLEEVMLDFIAGETDILVCTTIVEAGLDIPNVNTIIVDEADHFGLSQLYQLRGRVGRSNRLAYAYFFYRKDKVLTEVAEKRLQAIKEFTEFGSGIRIAMRDLEIRGAGNILGPEQHGHLLAVGFELYCQMLEEAIQQAKGVSVLPPADAAVELKLDAYLPDAYIKDGRQKINLYKKIAAVRTEADVEDIIGEMEDRYGELPAAADNLLRIAHLRVLAREARINSITPERETVVLKFADVTDIDGARLWQLVQEYRRQVTLTAAKVPYLTVRLSPAQDTVLFLLELLRRLRSCVSRENKAGE